MAVSCDVCGKSRPNVRCCEINDSYAQPRANHQHDRLIVLQLDFDLCETCRGLFEAMLRNTAIEFLRKKAPTPGGSDDADRR